MSRNPHHLTCMTDRFTGRVRYDGFPREQRVIARVIGLYGSARGLGNYIGSLWPRWEEGSGQG